MPEVRIGQCTLPKIDLNEVKRLLQIHDKSVAASRTATASLPVWAKHYVGLVGYSSTVDVGEILPGHLSIRSLKTSPSAGDVFRAARIVDKSTIEAGRWIDQITHEIVIGFDDLNSSQVLHISFITRLAISIISGVYCVSPLVNKHSHDSILCAEKESLTFGFLGGANTNHYGLGHRSIDLSGRTLLPDIIASLLELHEQNENLRTQVACQVLTSWPQSPNPRIALSSIWSGIDALFGKNEPQAKRRLCERIANFLGDATYSELVEAYEVRCNAVHGHHCDNQTFLEGIAFSEEVLRSCLRKIALSERQPLPDKA